ncbi:hypothetical protein Tco_1410131 [Tanacetum coccineum]
MEPEDSLIIRDENLSTIPEKESDEFIKSSVEDLVPIPRESEDTSDSDKECDLPFCDNFVTFSNPLFDTNDDFTSSDDESLPEEHDIEEKDSLFTNFDEPALLIHLVRYFEEDYYNSKGDIIYLECFLTNDTTHNLPPKVFLDHDPTSLNDEPNFDELKRSPLSFPTFVIKIFLPFLIYLVNSLLLSSGSEDTIFDPDIFAFSFYSLESVAYHGGEPFMCFPIVYLNFLNKKSDGDLLFNMFRP